MWAAEFSEAKENMKITATENFLLRGIHIGIGEEIEASHEDAAMLIAMQRAKPAAETATVAPVRETAAITPAKAPARTPARTKA